MVTPYFFAFLAQVTHYLTALKIFKKSIEWKIFARASLSVHQLKKKQSMKMWVSGHKKAVLMFNHDSKLTCHVHECFLCMDFENIEVFGHNAHYHQRIFLDAWMSVKDWNAGNDPQVPSTYLKFS